MTSGHSTEGRGPTEHGALRGCPGHPSAKPAPPMADGKTETATTQNESGFKRVWQTKCVDYNKNYARWLKRPSTILVNHFRIRRLNTNDSCLFLLNYHPFLF